MLEAMVPPGENCRQDAALPAQLRQQLGNLMAATHLLTPAVRELGSDKNDGYLAMMNQSLYRLLRLVDHLEFSRDMDGGAYPFHPAPLDLAGLCHALAWETGDLAALAGLRFRYESQVGSLLTTGDEALLRRLILCLFSGALRAAGPGGEAGLHLTKRRNSAILTVWDSRSGIPSPAEELLSPEDGRGPDLRTLRSLAELHGGTVMLESGPQRGLRAVVSLPILPPTPGNILTPPPKWDLIGGFPPTLVELSDLLPYQAFLPDDLA